MAGIPPNAIPPDYDSDPERARAAQEAVRRYSSVGDVHERVTERILAEKLSPVLDIGCGEGRLLKLLRARGVASVGLDNSPTMLATVSEPKVLADATDIPFPDRHFGCVAALYVLYHLDDPRRAMAESRRVLRQNGLFVACAPSRNDAPELARFLPAEPPITFDAENGPEMVREFFQDVEVEARDAPLMRLPDRDALTTYLRGHGVPLPDIQRIAKEVSTPLTLTKRGALMFGCRRP